ncbi:hypothetical protein MKX03_001125 [Papaver bracteatum]|nr:hypothetical protein MKX03_001125 [Papaver bracteatum]
MECIQAAPKMLMLAARVGELDRFKTIAAVIDQFVVDGIPGIVNNTKDPDSGARAIHHAASGGRVNVLKYLIEDMKGEIDVKDGSGKTPLFHAAMEGRLAAVEYLLEMGANPEIPDDSNTSPLHHVAGRGHKDVIPLLLSKGINVDVIDDFGSPLQYAVTANKPDTVRVLLDHGANPNLVFHDTFTPLQASIASQSWQCAEQILKAGADPNGGGDGVKPLIVAAEVGAKEIIKDEPRGTTQVIKLLVDAGADPNVTHIVS